MKSTVFSDASSSSDSSDSRSGASDRARPSAVASGVSSSCPSAVM